MFDVNHNAEDTAGQTNRSEADDPLLHACAEFASAFDAWRLLMKEGNHAIPPCENMTYEDVRKTKQRWRTALVRVRSMPAKNRYALEAKRRVLGELSHFGEADDPSFVEFAVELADEFHRYLCEGGSFAAGETVPQSRAENATKVGSSRSLFKLHKIFGIFYN